MNKKVINFNTVPVIYKGKPLMPTKPSRARRWIKEKKATPFWNKGVWCVRLNVNPSDLKLQDVVLGIDPGSKKEGFTVRSEAHHYLNIEAEAVTHVKKRVKDRKMMRKNRRNRKTPCRKNRSNRKRTQKLPPSTKARWQWKLRIIKWLRKLFPINIYIIEDVKAMTKKGMKRWNSSFSPSEQGKSKFYKFLSKFGKVSLKELKLHL